LVLLVGIIITVQYLSLPLPSTQPLTPNPQSLLPLPDKPSIVVLPFMNMSEDPTQEYFSDGMTEELTSSLSLLPSLFVIARTSAFTYKGKAVKVQDVSKELGVRYVLEGSVRKADDRVRVTAQLIDATNGSHQWAERYDRPFKDIFALQDEIVQKIVANLQVEVREAELARVRRIPTDNLTAYDSYLRGVEAHIRYTKEANIQAQQFFERAITLDPQYAQAYAALSATYIAEWIWRWSADPQTLERALALAQQALALDDSLAHARARLGEIYAYKQQYDQAVAESERAIALDPNNADNYVYQAEVLLLAGRPEEALRSVQQAMRLNPRYLPWYLALAGWAYHSTGRYEEAITALKTLLVRNPNLLTAHLDLAVSYIRQWISQQNSDAQTLVQALAAAQRGVALNDALPGGHIVLGAVYLHQKQYELAITEMQRAIALDPNEAISYAVLAETLGWMGRREEALPMVEQALHLKPKMVDVHLGSIGTAYYLAGKSEEAIAPLKQYLSRYPNILGAHLYLAAVYSELGKEAEAQAEAAEVLRLNPSFSLEVHKQRIPPKDSAILERHIAALRKAGLK
jgi:TolB-like protein/Tfp pilus assembly protein PilF